MFFTAEDTIFAQASAKGKSGVSIIRISGDGAELVLKKMCLRKKITSRHATYCSLFNPVTQDHIDDALVIFFQSPKSFTGEDVLELHIHGSNIVIKEIFCVLTDYFNFRIAEPGEFSKRAWLNGKMDLLKAEAIADLIQAETSIQKKQALFHYHGFASKKIYDLRIDILEQLSFLEAYIDFPDEDIPEEILNKISTSISDVSNQIDSLINDNKIGEKIREGIHFTIIGPPNSGKSSFLNEIAQREVAITSEYSGTTRDLIEIEVDIAGYHVIITDTAGIRISSDYVEKIGIKKAIELATSTDFVIIMYDAKLFLDDEKEFFSFIESLDDEIKNKNGLILFNKIDLISSQDKISKLQSNINNWPTYPISLIDNLGVDIAKKAMISFLDKSYNLGESILITRERHRSALKKCLKSLKNFHDIDIINDCEYACEELRIAMNAIAEITGDFFIDDILDNIFSNFCIGK